MIASFLAGCMIAVAIGGSLLVAACGLTTCWRASDARAERVCEVLFATAALAVALVQALGFAGALQLGAVSTAAVGCGALAWFGARSTRERLALLRLDLATGTAALRRSLPLSAAALLGLFLACRGLSLPELSWDGWTYHLSYPAHWVQTGSFDRFEAGGVWEQYESFPKAGEALFFLAMLPFHADWFVHWVNVPCWIGIGLAIRATARRLETSERTADVCALLAVGCPALSAYVTPSYVEVSSTFAFSVAIAAAVRCLVARDATALAPFWLALGLGAAIKVTALAYLPLGILVTLFAMRALSPAACARPTGVGMLLGTVVASPWYLHNLVQCSNPLYPAGLPGATDGPAAGTLENLWAVRESEVLAQAAVGDVLEHLARPPWQVRYPLGPGWLFLGAFALCCVLAIVAAVRGNRIPAIFAALAIALVLIYAVSPWNGVFREANTRFLMPATIAALLGIAAATTSWGRLRCVLAGLGIASVVAALSKAAFVRDGISSWAAAVAVLLTFGFAVAVVHASKSARSVLTLSLTAALALAALGFAIRTRELTRHAAYANRVDLHPGARSPALWQFVESLPPSRIAFSVGDVAETEGWFFFPLFGARLQHQVEYVDIELADSPACVRRGLIRDQPDRNAWRDRVVAGRFNYLAITGRALEREWAESDPSLFRRVFSSTDSIVFQVLPADDR